MYPVLGTIDKGNESLHLGKRLRRQEGRKAGREKKKQFKIYRHMFLSKYINSEDV